jgi:acyl-CoA thioester hydrolase
VTSVTRAPPADRSEFAHWSTIATRWHDNDVYGHVNNVVYYGYFDTVVNAYAISRGGLDIHAGSVIGIVVDSACRYHSPLAFPQVIDAGLRVDQIGRSSIRYALGLFAEGAPKAAAEGHFVHVIVDRRSRRPVEIPLPLKDALSKLAVT